MIEFQTIQQNEHYDMLRVFLDGDALAEARATAQSDGTVHIHTRDEETARLISRNRFADLPARLDLSLPYTARDGEVITLVLISTERHKSEGKERGYCFDFEAAPELARWSRPYSFEQYCDAFSNSVASLKSWQLTFETGSDDVNDVSFFRIRFPITAQVGSVAVEIARRSEVLLRLHKQVEAALVSAQTGNSLSVGFDFPEHVRVPCEQYLLYFVEFLRDLGVEATSDLTHDVGRVLFTVTPANTHQALDKIRAALEVYLRLPSSPVSESHESRNEISVQKLTANLHHLRGQLDYLKR